MAGRADAARTHIDFARIDLGICDEVRDRLHRQRRIDYDDQRRTLDAGDRRNVAGEAEVEIVIERLVDNAGRAGQQKRVAIRRRMGHEAGADIGAGAATVLDDDLLIETLRHRLGHKPRDNVERAAGRDGNDETDRFVRIGVRMRAP